ncbi:hypothetical protein TgHK011_002121 [Trichoderma gracile]|nr:hypothetical protein TgHK011_002121 [Trichoderma gracile]
MAEARARLISPSMPRSTTAPPRVPRLPPRSRDDRNDGPDSRRQGPLLCDLMAASAADGRLCPFQAIGVYNHYFNNY